MKLLLLFLFGLVSASRLNSNQAMKRSVQKPAQPINYSCIVAKDIRKVIRVLKRHITEKGVELLNPKAPNEYDEEGHENNDELNDGESGVRQTLGYGFAAYESDKDPYLIYFCPKASCMEKELVITAVKGKRFSRGTLTGTGNPAETYVHKVDLYKSFLDKVKPKAALLPAYYGCHYAEFEGDKELMEFQYDMGDKLDDRPDQNEIDDVPDNDDETDGVMNKYQNTGTQTAEKYSQYLFHYEPLALFATLNRRETPTCFPTYAMWHDVQARDRAAIYRSMAEFLEVFHSQKKVFNGVSGNALAYMLKNNRPVFVDIQKIEDDGSKFPDHFNQAPFYYRKYEQVKKNILCQKDGKIVHRPVQISNGVIQTDIYEDDENYSGAQNEHQEIEQWVIPDIDLLPPKQKPPSNHIKSRKRPYTNKARKAIKARKLMQRVGASRSNPNKQTKGTQTNLNPTVTKKDAFTNMELPIVIGKTIDPHKGECTMQLSDDIYAMGKLLGEMELLLGEDVANQAALDGIDFTLIQKQLISQRNDKLLLDTLRYMNGLRNRVINDLVLANVDNKEPAMIAQNMYLEAEITFSAKILDVIARCLGFSYVPKKVNWPGGYVENHVGEIKDIATLKAELIKTILAGGDREFAPCIEDIKHARDLSQTQTEVIDIKSSATEAVFGAKRGVQFLHIGSAEHKSVDKKHRYFSMWPRRWWHTGWRHGHPVYMIPPSVFRGSTQTVQAETKVEALTVLETGKHIV